MESKEILESLGIEIAEDETLTPELLTQKVSERFITREQAKNDPDLRKAAFGEATGKLDQKIRKTFRSMGFEFTPEEEKGKDVEEFLALGLEKVQALKESASASQPDPKAEEWQKKYTQAMERIKLFETEQIPQLESQIEKERSEKENFVKGFKRDQMLEKVWSEVEFKDGLSDADKFYLRNGVIGDNFTFDLEGDNLVVKGKDGQPVYNPKRAGTLWTAKEVIQAKAAEKGYLKEAPSQPQKTQPPKQGQEPTPGVRRSAAALSHLKVS